MSEKTATTLLFFYGTLMHPHVLYSVICDTSKATHPSTFPHAKAAVPGFIRHPVRNKPYPAMVPSSEHRVHGIVTDTESLSLATGIPSSRIVELLDRFEGVQYRRVTVGFEVLEELGESVDGNDDKAANALFRESLLAGGEMHTAAAYEWTAGMDALEVGVEGWSYDEFVRTRLSGYLDDEAETVDPRTQPLASDVGRAILARGGNAADAAVAVAAALAVTEPCSTGIGGDAFCLFYNAKSRSVQALNASGRCPAGLDLALLRKLGVEGASLPGTSAHSVTVPGAAAGWVDTVEMFGSGNLTMHEILAPAIKLAQDGFPVSDLTAYFWGRGEERIKSASPNGHELLKNGKAPRAGELMKMPNYAKTMLSLGEHGKAGFYEGPVAEAIVSTLRELGSVITLEDLKSHTSTAVEPICIEYDGALKLYECPPNGQGITALIALGILEALQKETSTDFIEKGLNSVEYLHTLIESMRLAFADSQYYVTDPDVVHVPVKELLSKDYLSRRAKLVDTDKASVAVKHGSPANSSDTVYFSVVDKDGNACSFINSNYEGFGSAIVPKGCGFPLQNRGSNFILDETHPNCLAPGKRTYHTIIPAMVTHMDDSLHMCYGVMGGFMQPQGHVQVLMNMHHFKMLPQAALDAPRFCIMPERDGVSVVLIEEGIDVEVVEGLRRLGHEVQVMSGQQRANFGRGQIILRQVEAESIAGHVLVGGCDPRSDGVVAPAQ
ncbi:hypothetical protein CcCBS67573_g08517 [Chytriomyces confervae]|uniref:Gamma-glutamylcyclotransferase AIG2-like domain-containing protein n=1 Tax=Chytriomyces confervae TaxID=246404 RepID=A0A507ELF0_9FUNG|nr:hypothetical protein CcCBS67573_g08517 [Chytriomyces confervae]